VLGLILFYEFIDKPFYFANPKTDDALNCRNSNIDWYPERKFYWEPARKAPKEFELQEPPNVVHIGEHIAHPVVAFHKREQNSRPARK
jgi:hypothetical protein